MVHIIVSGIFKSGSTSLYDTLMRNNKNTSMYRITKKHIADHGFGKPGLGTHTFNKTDIILIPIRNQKETYISGFFQDIHYPRYNYSIFHTQENINICNNNQQYWKFFEKKFVDMYKDKHNLIYDHFINVYDYLTSSPLLNNNTIIEVIKDQDPTFNKVPVKKNGYVSKRLPNGCTVVFIDMKMLDNITILNEMLNELSINIRIMNLVSSNIGVNKIYANEYKTLSSTLRNNNYYDQDYYDFLDDNYEIVI